VLCPGEAALHFADLKLRPRGRDDDIGGHGQAKAGS
jgi:hypothetical protein